MSAALRHRRCARHRERRAHARARVPARRGGRSLPRRAAAAAASSSGRDTRRSGDMLEAALVAGICSGGADALAVRASCPTPAVALPRRASSRPTAASSSRRRTTRAEYNGIKFFSRDGFKLPDELEDEIEDVRRAPSATGSVRPARASGRVERARRRGRALHRARGRDRSRAT